MHRSYIARILLALVTALAVLLLAGDQLSKRGWKQQVNLRQAGKSGRQPNSPTMLVGTTIVSLRGRTISDQKTTVDLSHRKHGTLLLVLSPVCPYCRVNLHNWRNLLQGLSSDEVLWVDITGTADSRYLATAGISENANVILLDDDPINRNRFTATPTTVLLDPNGVVKWAWSGIMGDEQLDRVRTLLNFEKQDP
jgi:hypothetical protein